MRGACLYRTIAQTDGTARGSVTPAAIESIRLRRCRLPVRHAIGSRPSSNACRLSLDVGFSFLIGDLSIGYPPPGLSLISKALPRSRPDWIELLTAARCAVASGFSPWLLAPERHLPVVIGRLGHASAAGDVFGSGRRLAASAFIRSLMASGELHRSRKLTSPLRPRAAACPGSLSRAMRQML